MTIPPWCVPPVSDLLLFHEEALFLKGLHKGNELLYESMEEAC